MRFSKLSLCVVLAGAVLTLVGCDKRAKDREEIATLFRDFQLATNNCSGEDAASCLSFEAIEWYDRMLALARDGTAAKVRALSPVEKSQILLVRGRLTRKQTEGWKGRDLIIYQTKQGWASDKDSTLWTLRQIRFKDTSASAEIVIEDEPTEHRIRFVLENAAWKYDDTSINGFVNLLIESGADDEGLSVDDALLKWEAEESGKVLGPEIWGPMK